MGGNSMDTVELRIHHTVETLKATRGATWLLEHLQSLVIPSAQVKQQRPDVELPPIITPEEEKEREELAKMSQQGMQIAYGDDEYEYNDADMKWVNPKYANF